MTDNHPLINTVHLTQKDSKCQLVYSPYALVSFSILLQPGVIMRGEWDAIVQQKGGASPVVNQYYADTSLQEGVTQDQLVEQQTPTIVQSDESSSTLPTLPNDAAAPAPSSGEYV